MGHIRIGHEGILPDNPHRPNLTLHRIIERFDLGDPLLRIHRNPPDLFELRLGNGIHYLLEAGIVVWQRPAIPRPLDIVLPPKRVDPSTSLTEIPGQERQITERLNVSDTTDMFCDPERVINPSPLRFGKIDRGPANIFRRYPGNLFGPFRRKLFYMLRIRFIVGRPGRNVLLVFQPFFDNDIRHCVEERDIRTKIESQETVRMIDKPDSPWIDHY